MNNEACTRSLDGYRHTSTLLNASEKNFNKLYLDPLPENVKVAAGVAGTLARKEIRVVVKSGVVMKLNFSSGVQLGCDINY